MDLLHVTVFPRSKQRGHVNGITEAFRLEKTFRIMEYFCKPWLCCSHPLAFVPIPFSVTSLLTLFSSVEAASSPLLGMSMEQGPAGTAEP